MFTSDPIQEIDNSQKCIEMLCENKHIERLQFLQKKGLQCTIVFLQNNVCDTGGNGNMDGTCYTAEECTARDGVATGSCADGYGVCCVSKY